MGCCNLKRELTDFQLSIQSGNIRQTNEFNEVCLDSMPKNDDFDKKLNTTVGSTGTYHCVTQRKDIEAAFLMPTIRRNPN